MMKLLVMVIGGAAAAMAGAIEVQFISAWAPAGWTYPETFGLFAAVIVGGRGNLGGVAVGAFLVQGLFLEGTVLLPNFGSPEVIGAVQWMSPGGADPALHVVPPAGRHPGAPAQVRGG